MRIRRQLQAIAALSTGLCLLAGLVVVAAAREEERTDTIQASAQTTLHAMAGLLVLTQEYARHTEDHVAEQWRLRHQAIAAGLEAPHLRSVASPGLTELRSATLELAPLFARLREVARAGDTFGLQRRDMLLDQLQTHTQSMTDYAAQWYQDAALQRRDAEVRFRVAALLAPATIALALAFLIAVVGRRVLVPLARIEDATRAVAGGDLASRIGNAAPDELGELARHFDAMTQTLAQRGQQLRQSERQLRAVTDNLPVLIAYFDGEERFRFANAHHRTLFGLDPDSLIGTTLADHLGPAAYANARAEVARTLAGEHRHYERDGFGPGRNRHAIIDFIPDIDAQGQVVGFYSLVADITERRNAELAQAHSERLLRLIADNLPTLISYIDREQRFHFVNAHYEDVLGVRPETLLGQPVGQALGPQTAALIAPYLAKALAGQRQHFERASEFRGKTVHLQTDYIPDLDAEGRVSGVFAMAVDVTRLKEMQAHLQASEQRLRQIADNLPVLISYLDREQRLRFVNETYRVWLGVDPATLLGRKSSEVFGPALYATRRAYLERTLAGERVEFSDEAIVNGVLRCTTVSYIPDVDADGQVQGLYALTTDVTPLKLAEREMAQLARVDALTGLPNRLRFNEKLSEALLRAERSGDGMALMFLDIDRFKSINDTLGHAAGDAVLQEFGRRLAGCVRATDTVARLAGDEFVVVLESLHDEAEPRRVAEKIVAQIGLPMQLDEQPLAVTTSIGVAFHRGPGDAAVAERLLGRADAALYDAKNAGRNRYHVAQPEATA